ncbi:MAG: penicillin-binding protein 2 [Nocardioidaceae bacterium]|nr:penicillin-binding protein 2 [Nocardioidaceae bacterium]NUS53188.1 penicillin-binding protein 2 [Nocardioidaceae bacterium]
MNKPIRAMSIFCLLLFVALLLNATWLQYVDANALNGKVDNKRVRDAEFSRKRGAILAGGASVAESVRTSDQYKYQRVYKQPRKYAHITGYYSYLYGRSGVEQSENDILSGSDPRLFVNRVVDMLGNSQPKGGSVALTVDPQAQNRAVQGLGNLGRDAKGAVVALEPSTGKILALASTPTYDPNKLASHDFAAVQKAYERLSTSKDQKMLDRGIQETYPPGSTFKLVTAAAALSSGQYTPNTPVAGGSSLDLPQTTANLPNEPGLDCGTDRIPLTQALENSCNTAFGEIGLKLGDDALREQAQKFGFDQTYLEDLPGQVRSRFPANPDEPQTALSAIGQYDVAATPLQMAMVASGIANGGTVMRPYIVDEVRAPDLSVLDKTNPEAFRSNAVSSSVARELTQMMIEVVDNGTGQTAQMPGIKVAGKTGTAQRGPDQAPYAWFVSFAPADDPQVAVAVLVDDPSVPRGEISGSGLAAPIAKSVMDAVINR